MPLRVMQSAGAATYASAQIQCQDADVHSSTSLQKRSDHPRTAYLRVQTDAHLRRQGQRRRRALGRRHAVVDSHGCAKRSSRACARDLANEEDVSLPPAITSGAYSTPIRHHAPHKCFSRPDGTCFRVKQEGQPAPPEPYDPPRRRPAAQHNHTQNAAGAAPLIAHQQHLLRMLLHLPHSQMRPGIAKAVRNAQIETLQVVAALCEPVAIPRPPITTKQVDPWVSCACEANPVSPCTAPGLCIRKDGVRVCHVVDVNVLHHIEAYFPPTLKIVSMARVQNPARKRAYLARRLADIDKLTAATGGDNAAAAAAAAAAVDDDDDDDDDGAAAVVEDPLEAEVRKDMKLDTRVECRAFHCTTARNINTIHVHGLRRECARMGTLGRAIYATPEPSKANKYFKSPGTGELRYMLGLRVLPGRLHSIAANGASFPFLDAPPQQCDSLTAVRQGEQELAIFDNDRVLVEYIIGYYDLQDCPPVPAPPVAHPLFSAQAKVTTPTPPRSPPSGLGSSAVRKNDTSRSCRSSVSSTASSNSSHTSNGCGSGGGGGPAAPVATATNDDSGCCPLAPTNPTISTIADRGPIARHQSAKRGAHSCLQHLAFSAHQQVPQKRWKSSSSPTPPHTSQPEPAGA